MPSSSQREAACRAEGDIAVSSSSGQNACDHTMFIAHGQSSRRTRSGSDSVGSEQKGNCDTRCYLRNNRVAWRARWHETFAVPPATLLMCAGRPTRGPSFPVTYPIADEISGGASHSTPRPVCWRQDMGQARPRPTRSRRWRRPLCADNSTWPIPLVRCFQTDHGR